MSREVVAVMMPSFDAALFLGHHGLVKRETLTVDLQKVHKRFEGRIYGAETNQMIVESVEPPICTKPRNNHNGDQSL